MNYYLKFMLCVAIFQSCGTSKLRSAAHSKSDTCYESNYATTILTTLFNEISSEKMWQNLDTVNLSNNSFLVFIGNNKIISNSKFAEITFEIRKTNIDGQTSQQILVDKENRIIYDLSSKSFFEFENQDEQLKNYVASIETDSTGSNTKVILLKNESKIMINLRNDIPNAVAAKIFALEINSGVASIYMDKERVKLTSFKSINDVDFESKLKSAKLNCTTKGKKVDLLFPLSGFSLK